jgi:hypothetical protein
MGCSWKDRAVARRPIHPYRFSRAILAVGAAIEHVGLFVELGALAAGPEWQA